MQKVITCAMVALAALAEVRAAEPVKQTSFVINDPCEIPSMILEPGHYVFKLVEHEQQRNVLDVFETVQLWTGDETRLLSTLLTMPNYDQPTTDKTVFTFFERSPKQPKALHIWFAPGRNYGQEFVYPKQQAMELAKSVGRPVLSMPVELPGDLGKLAAAPLPQSSAARAATPAAAPQPSPPPIKTAASSVAPPPVPAPARKFAVAPAPVESRARAAVEPKMIASSLPKTASYLALFAVMGLLGIFAGVLLRILELRLENHR